MNVSVLIHGPWENNCLDMILAEISSYSIQKSSYNFSVMIVCYKKDEEKLNFYLNTLVGISIKIQTIIVKDLFNPGFCNINRQLATVKAGLEKIDNNEIVIKLRNDQIVNFRKLFYFLKRVNYLQNDSRKFITTNCFTRKDRLYHPSDMFLVGWRKDLYDYYDTSFIDDTAAEYKMKLVKIIESDSNNFQRKFLSPESYLFTNYLKRMKWKLKYTVADSFNAINTYFFVINSWDIDFRWNKIRAPWKKRGHLILPMYGSASVFGWPTPIYDDNGKVFKEKMDCYEKSDFTGFRTKKDEYYINLSKRIYTKLFGD